MVRPRLEVPAHAEGPPAPIHTSPDEACAPAAPGAAPDAPEFYIDRHTVISRW